MSDKSNSLWGELANSYAPFGYTEKHCKHHKKCWGVAHLTHADTYPVAPIYIPPCRLF